MKPKLHSLLVVAAVLMSTIVQANAESSGWGSPQSVIKKLTKQKEAWTKAGKFALATGIECRARFGKPEINITYRDHPAYVAHNYIFTLTRKKIGWYQSEDRAIRAKGFVKAGECSAQSPGGNILKMSIYNRIGG